MGVVAPLTAIEVIVSVDLLPGAPVMLAEAVPLSMIEPDTPVPVAERVEPLPLQIPPDQPVPVKVADVIQLPVLLFVAVALPLQNPVPEAET